MLDDAIAVNADNGLNRQDKFKILLQKEDQEHSILHLQDLLFFDESMKI